MTELDDAYDPRIDQLQARYAKRRAARDRHDLRAVLETEEGRRVIWRLFDRVDVMKNAHHASPSVRDYALGRQSVGQDLLQWVDAAGGTGAFFRLADEMARDAKAELDAFNREKREVRRDDL